MITFRMYAISLNMAIALMFFAFAITPAFSAEPKAWNAQEVLELSDELYSAARHLTIACRQMPPNYLDQEGSGGHLEFRYHVRHFQSVAGDLVDALENGKNMQETKPIFDTALDMMPGMNKYTSLPGAGSWHGVANAVKKVDEIVVKLGAYYN